MFQLVDARFMAGELAHEIVFHALQAFHEQLETAFRALVGGVDFVVHMTIYIVKSLVEGVP